MKITHKTAAQSLLLLAACLPAAAQIALNPGQYPNESSPVVSVPYHEDKVRTLQGQLEGYERQLRQKSAMVENAREEAILPESRVTAPDPTSMCTGSNKRNWSCYRLL